MYDHQKDWAVAHMARLNQLHQDFLAKYNAAQYLQIEGMTECTVRSQSVEVSIGVSDMDITQAVIEIISNKLDDVERRIKHHKLLFAEELSEAPQLAQQAAATAAPTQKGPGRPRKPATPKPELMEAVGAMAAQVPMNSAGQLPSGGVANQPQG